MNGDTITGDRRDRVGYVPKLTQLEHHVQVEDEWSLYARLPRVRWKVHVYRQMKYNYLCGAKWGDACLNEVIVRVSDLMKSK